MIQTIKINNKITSVKVNDNLNILFEDRSLLTLEDYHWQDCCEDVAVDWNEIPKDLLKSLIEVEVTKLEISTEEEGLLLHFYHSPIPNKELPENLWQNRISILVGCHNYQNGYYSRNLIVKIRYKDLEIETEQLEFTDIDNSY